MKPSIVPTTRNRVLRSLSRSVTTRLLSQMQFKTLVDKQTLHPAGKPIDMVYFPEHGWISLTATLGDGTLSEVGIIGLEGMAGMSVVFGIDRPFNEAMVQSPGAAWCMPVQAFKNEIAGTPELRNYLLRYAETLFAQVSQTAACNNFHHLDARLARWLLMAADRTDGSMLPLTQEFLSMMLGVQRSSVTAAAGHLQAARLIRYSNGTINVLDRDRLETAACSCYRTVRDHSERLLGNQFERDVG